MDMFFMYLLDRDEILLKDCKNLGLYKIKIL
jgi:hypothetical protein